LKADRLREKGMGRKRRRTRRACPEKERRVTGRLKIPNKEKNSKRRGVSRGCCGERDREKLPV